MQYNFLRIKKSSIKNAGKGVFTKRNFKKEEVICEVIGEVVKVKNYIQRIEKCLTVEGYAIEITSKRYLDTYHTEQCAKYINDAYKSNFKNNCEFIIDENEKIYVVALSNIMNGEELFITYGKEYWKTIVLL
jgi:SET domain-containing protein